MFSILKLKTFLVLIAGLFLYFFMSWVGVIGQTIIFFIYTLVLMSLYEKSGIFHPISWFPPLLFIYSISYPLYLVLYEGGYSEKVNQVIPYCFIGLIAFVFSFNLFEKRSGLVNANFQKDDNALRVIAYIFIIVCNILNLIVVYSGATTKREYLTFVENSGLGPLFTSFFFLSLICALLLKNNIERVRGIKFDNILVISFFTFLFSFAVSGERDLLFRFILLCGFVLLSYKYTYKVWKLIAGLSIFLFILPITQEMKAFFVSNEQKNIEYQEGSFLNSEFASAGKNIYYLLERNITNYGIDIFLNDFLRFFNFLGFNNMSATAWFNEVIRTQYGDSGTSGWGFSLVGEGYVAYGALGVLGLFLFLGVITAFMYNNARKKIIFCLYLLYIPTMIYVIRADFGNFLSLNFKVNLFIVFTLFMMILILSRFKRKGFVNERS